MKKECEKSGLVPAEKAPGALGKAIGSLGAHAKETVAMAQNTVMHAVDRNGNGKIDAEDFGLTRENIEGAGEAVKDAAIAAGHGLKAGGAAMGKAFSEARLELDLKNLKPVFPDALPFDDGQTDAAQPSIVAVVARDKRRSESEACRGAVGYYQSAKGYELLNLYEDYIPQLKLVFYPAAAKGVFLADPYQRGVYIALDEYFDFIRKALVNELEVVAQDLGAKHVRISFKEDKKSLAAQKLKANAKTKVESVSAEHKTSVDEFSSVEIAADVKFSGHTSPVIPPLVYFKNESDIVKLVRMRTSDGSNKIESKTYRFQCNRLFGAKEEDSAQICAILNGIKCTGSASFSQNIQRESRTILEYSIEF